MSAGIRSEIECYLRSGDTDPYAAAGPGDFLERHGRAHDDLRAALVAEVEARSRGKPAAAIEDEHKVAELVRRKLEPMVAGLFPRAERGTVRGQLEGSFVFLTADRIRDVLLGVPWPRTAWDLANLYLASVGAELLGAHAPSIVGLSEGTTCFVSAEYFDHDEPFADFVVHEAAHVFHTCKRRTVGLPATPRREWLLDVAYSKREVFAYSCEAYARILERSRSPRERVALAEQYESCVEIVDERADPREVAAIVRQACAARAGWKVLLARCSPPRRPRRERRTPSQKHPGR
jgi:hypothetical protein